jgi:hypothetical protein
MNAEFGLVLSSLSIMPVDLDPAQELELLTRTQLFYVELCTTGLGHYLPYF